MKELIERLRNRPEASWAALMEDAADALERAEAMAEAVEQTAARQNGWPSEAVLDACRAYREASHG